MTNEARVAIHMSHRVGAIFTLVVVGALCIGLLRSPLRRARRLGVVIGAVLGLQVFLGLGNILFQFPVAVATAHNAGGALLLLTLVTLNYYLVTMRSTAAEVSASREAAVPAGLVGSS